MFNLKLLLKISYLLLSIYGVAYFQFCSNKLRCSDCLRASAECGWCEEAKFVDNVRCDVNFGDLCQGSIVKPEKRTTVTEDNEFGDFVQIKPQKVTVDLRIGDSQTFSVSVKRAANYPVDLYYLMDVSNSMADDLVTLQDLAPKLIETVGNLTTNFRMGFGKFVDKETLPYVDTFGERLIDPCGGPPCEAAFAFINSLPLNEDSNVFQTEIKKESTSANLDLPEGLLDALMQTAVCQDAIKWKKDAWHLVVIATDAQFHTAGDGKLAGIYTPNDGLCHLNSSTAGGKYMNATLQDYPSVSQIRQVLFENRIIPMFAAAGGQESLYKALSEALRPVTSFAAELDQSSLNILELIKEGYEEIAGRVTMTAVDKSDGKLKIEVKVVDCQGANATELDDPVQQGCKDIKEGETAVFDVTVTLTECGSGPFGVDLDAGAFGQTEVVINALCDCVCEQPVEVNSSSCSSNGDLECGVCVCHHPWAGPTCSERCDPNSTPVSLCKPDNASISDPVCSGRGQCVCGCQCDTDDNGRALYSGDYCQCPQLSCSRDSSGNECGGPGKGECICSGPDCACKCHCSANVRSKDNPTCECLDESVCENDNGHVCSNRGSCTCEGNCDCNGGYIGQFCGECLDCQLCSDNGITACVTECLKRGESVCESTPDCDFVIIIIDERPPENHKIKYKNQSYDVERCSPKDAEDCINIFYISTQPIDNATYVVEALGNKFRDCPGSIDVVPIIVGIVAGIFAVGLFILFAWWILMQLAAYREYKAFVKEQANASWNQTTSPLYEPPSQKYMNPTYKGKGQKA